QEPVWALEGRGAHSLHPREQEHGLGGQAQTLVEIHPPHRRSWRVQEEMAEVRREGPDPRARTGFLQGKGTESSCRYVWSHPALQARGQRIEEHKAAPAHL